MSIPSKASQIAPANELVGLNNIKVLFVQVIKIKMKP